MSARRQIIAALSEDSLGGIATLQDVDHAEQLVNAHRAEVLAEAAALADPKKPEVSFFGQYGPQVAWWLRMLVGGQEKATAPAAATPKLTDYRAAWDVAPLDTYTTEAEARKHCEDHARRDLPTASFDWIVDEEDGVAELVATVDGAENPTGYVVTALEIASKYDPEADE